MGRREAVVACVVAALVVTGCSSGTTVRRGLETNPNDIATSAEDAVFTVDCTFSHRAMDDPIVHPGEPGASHSHDFFGNTSTNASSTTATLRGKPTTCADKEDTSSYWVPTLFRDGVVVDASVSRAYYRATVGADVIAVRAPPAGLKVLAGDAHATKPQRPNVAGWGCGFRPGRLTVQPPPRCSVASPLTLVLHFPDCWDGVHLDIADHRAHMAYSQVGRCPRSHPVQIAQLQFSVQYPIWGLTGTIGLGSGSFITAHGDFVNSWVEPRLVDQVDTCIHAKANCTID